MNGNCPVCNGELVLLGQLGNREHFRCRDCGADCSKLVKKEPVEAE